MSLLRQDSCGAASAAQKIADSQHAAWHCARSDYPLFSFLLWLVAFAVWRWHVRWRRWFCGFGSWAEVLRLGWRALGCDFFFFYWNWRFKPEAPASRLCRDSVRGRCTRGTGCLARIAVLLLNGLVRLTPRRLTSSILLS